MQVRPGVGRRAATKALREIAGVSSVVATFGADADAELARLYTVTVEPSAAESVLRALAADPRVEFAERAPRPRLGRK